MPSSTVRKLPAIAAFLLYGCIGGGPCDSGTPGKYSAQNNREFSVNVTAGSGLLKRIAAVRVRIDASSNRRAAIDASSNVAAPKEETYILPPSACSPGGDCNCGAGANCPLFTGQVVEVGNRDGSVVVEVEALGFSAPIPSADAGTVNDSGAGADAGGDGGIRTDANAGVATPQAARPVLIRRRARGRVPSGKSSLTINLDALCVSDDGGPTCGLDTTCNVGKCTSDAFTIDDLAVGSGRPASGPEVCAVGGPPEIFVGTGEFEYESVDSGDSVKVYSGSQGGLGSNQELARQRPVVGGRGHTSR
jgi:hypothetical protein